MKRINRDGPPRARRVSGARRASRREQLAAALGGRRDRWWIRGRPREFVASAVPGTINIPANRAFTTWAGWLLPYDRDFYPVRRGAAGARRGRARSRGLAGIGLDRVAGYAGPDVLAQWQAVSGPLQTIPAIGMGELAEAMAEGSVLVAGRARALGMGRWAPAAGGEHSAWRAPAAGSASCPAAGRSWCNASRAPAPPSPPRCWRRTASPTCGSMVEATPSGARRAGPPRSPRRSAARPEAAHAREPSSRAGRRLLGQAAGRRPGTRGAGARGAAAGGGSEAARDAIPAFAAWVEGLGVWGPVAFVAGYALATVAFVPGSLLTLAAGAIFGLGKGTALVFVAATLGASVAFLIARYLARGPSNGAWPGTALCRASIARSAAEGRQDRAAAAASRRSFRSTSSTTPSGLRASGSPITSWPRSACCRAPCSTCTPESWWATWPGSPPASRFAAAPAIGPVVTAACSPLPSSHWLVARTARRALQEATDGHAPAR